MVNELQKKHVQEVVEKILAQIDWPPEKLCELAIRAALAVSKSPEGAEFREWAEMWLNNNAGSFNLINNNLQLDLDYIDRESSTGRELLAAHNSMEALRDSKYTSKFGKLSFESDINCALLNAKLAAKLRGENLEISEIIKEIKIQEEV